MAGYRNFTLAVLTGLFVFWTVVSTAQLAPNCGTGALACVFALEQNPDGTEAVHPSSTRLTGDDLLPMSFVEKTYVGSIIAKGLITPGTAHRFESFLAATDVRAGYEVALNSPGGDLAEALVMGRLIRKHRLNTTIASVEGNDNRPGECDSSCNFVFMGGVVRDAGRLEGRFGVHRFQLSGEAPPIGTLQSEAAQIASAELVRYVQEMGVDAYFLTFMARFHDITYLPVHILRTLKINNGENTRWQNLVLNGNHALEAVVGVLPDVYHVVDLVCKPGVTGRHLIANVALSEPDNEKWHDDWFRPHYLEMVIQLTDLTTERRLIDAGQYSKHDAIIDANRRSSDGGGFTPRGASVPTARFNVGSGELFDPIRKSGTRCDLLLLPGEEEIPCFRGTRLTASFRMTARITALFTDPSVDSIGMEFRIPGDSWAAAADAGGEYVAASMILDMSRFHRRVSEFVNACR